MDLRKKLYICGVKHINTYKSNKKMYTRTITVQVNPNSLRQRMLALAVGETMFVPLAVCAETTVRNYASTLKFIGGRSFKVSRDHDRHGVIVKREA